MRSSGIIFLVLFGAVAFTGAQGAVIYNQAQVQRGARLFMQHCSGCHSLRYVRHSRLSEDLGIYSTEYSPLLSSLSIEQAQHWFGRVPPDLSLIAHVKGSTWLRDYLTGFYPDKYRPFGVNNYVIRDVAMPDILSGIKYELKNGVIEDLLAFLDYTSLPERGVRYALGAGVLVFLLLCAFLTYLRDRTVPDA